MGTPTHKLWDRVYDSQGWIKLIIASKRRRDELEDFKPSDIELRSTPTRSNGASQYLVEARSLR